MSPDHQPWDKGVLRIAAIDRGQEDAPCRSQETGFDHQWANGWTRKSP